MNNSSNGLPVLPANGSAQPPPAPNLAYSGNVYIHIDLKGEILKMEILATALKGH